jgi:hypothetical protein
MGQVVRYLNLSDLVDFIIVEPAFLITKAVKVAQRFGAARSGFGEVSNVTNTRDRSRAYACNNASSESRDPSPPLMQSIGLECHDRQ